MEGLGPPEILDPTLIKQMGMCFDLCPWRFIFLSCGLQQFLEFCDTMALPLIVTPVSPQSCDWKARGRWWAFEP